MLAENTTDRQPTDAPRLIDGPEWGRHVATLARAYLAAADAERLARLACERHAALFSDEPEDETTDHDGAYQDAYDHAATAMKDLRLRLRRALLCSDPRVAPDTSGLDWDDEGPIVVGLDHVAHALASVPLAE